MEGVEGWRLWRRFTWPLVRPGVARALGLVFAVTLFDPGTPLVLGLRRTLGYQAVASALDGGPGQGARAAVLALMATALAGVGRVLIGWWGGPPTPGWPDEVAPSVRRRPAGWGRSAVFTLCLVAAGVAACLPLAGVVVEASGGWRGRDPQARRAVVCSVELGLAALAVALVLARSQAAWWSSRRRRSRIENLARALEGVPPLAVGIGALSLAPTVRAAAAAWAGSERGNGLLAALADVLDPEVTPGVMLALAVAVVESPRLARSALGRRSRLRRELVDAAVVLGATRREARRRISGRLLGVSRSAAFLTLVLAATSITPALVLAPTSEGRPIGPTILSLADAPGAGRQHAAVLAALAVGANLAALLAWFRGTGRDAEVPVDNEPPPI
jgi:iron(III) transport system permease protein